MDKHTIFLLNEKETLSFGARIADICRNSSCVIYIYGNLGVGKTTFCRGFLRMLGYTEIVKSPTYTLVESYELSYKTVHHFDLYRLTNAEELKFIGIHDYFNTNSLCLIEWPQKGKNVLPTADIIVTIKYQNKYRYVTIESFSMIGTKILTKY